MKLARLGRAKRMMVRRMFGVSSKNRKRSDELLSRLGTECVENKIQRARLRWFRHVEEKEEMHKDECDRCGGQRCSERNWMRDELCGEGHEGYGYKRGNGAGSLYLDV